MKYRISKRDLERLRSRGPWRDMRPELAPPDKPLSELENAVAKYRKAMAEAEDAKCEYYAIVHHAYKLRVAKTPSAEAEAESRAAARMVDDLYTAAWRIRDEIADLAIHCKLR